MKVKRGISIIMPSYLGEYVKSRSNPIPKFHRAVKSFIEQDYPKDKCELIIISDACELTIKEFKQYENISNIRLIKKTERSNGYPGFARQMGIEASKFDIISYLDTDDYLMNYRLSNINSNLKENLNITFDTRRMIAYEDEIVEEIMSTADGTWQIVHTKDIARRVKWKDSIERGEDSRFIAELISSVKIPKFNGHHYPSYDAYLRKIKSKYGIYEDIGGYVICHMVFSTRIKPTDI